MEFSRFSKLAEASVHGRFQPFHNEHLEYVLAAQELCDFLWIGITKYDVTATDSNPLGAIRERPENNPLTFFERVRIIREALIEAGVPAGSFGFVPFPIETPQRLPSFMPTTVPCFTTICEPWNREKIDVLRGLGYEVRVLLERTEKSVTGGAIRKDILEGGSMWGTMVPPATARAIEQLDLRSRLIKLKNFEPADSTHRHGTQTGQSEKF
jgi:nicotinamide mononucleotide adenylyltransferase